MRVRLPLMLLPLMAFSVQAWADDEAGKDVQNHRPQVSSQECGLSTPFNVLADSGGIWLYRDSGSPREIFFHGGQLSVDRKVQQISTADSQRLWEMERRARALMPQVTDIAHDVVNVTFDALGGAAQAITGDDKPPRKLRRQHEDVAKYVDSTLGTGRWDQEVFDEKFEARMEAAIKSYAYGLVRSALWQELTGRGDKMEERTDKLDDEMDKRLDAQTDAIEGKAKALCPQVEALGQLQDAMEFRYQGQPLQMLLPEQEDKPGSGSDSSPTAPKLETSDKRRDGTIKVGPAQGK